MKIDGQLIDIHQKKVYPAEITVQQGRIHEIREVNYAPQRFIMPGLIDAHIHIESSMLIPSEFARLAVVHGTVATVSDPHEIANVLGIEGVQFMVGNGRKVPLKFFFGAPSCVPATTFETSGAEIDAEWVDKLLASPDIHYLSEMMNYPGVLEQDPTVMAKLASAKKHNKPVDGHAPGLRGSAARRYAAAGITTDHEAFSLEEGREKCQLGMKVIIREGSAARNYAALHPLIAEFPEQVMFCSDDKHPDDLVRGHINQLIARALSDGHDLFQVLRAATLQPVEHYGLDVGLLRIGDPADCIVVDALDTMTVQATYINGREVARDGQALFPSVEVDPINQFVASAKKESDFRVPAESQEVRVIVARDGDLMTGQTSALLPDQNGYLFADPSQDVLKIAVVNRYEDAPPAVAFVQGFGLQQGAIASCVGHDSHNIIAVGIDDGSLCRAVNEIIRNQGGISAVEANGGTHSLPLPIAGIMTHVDGYQTAEQYSLIDEVARNVLKSSLSAPFMTLSFMSLLVIPDLKLSDKGLFSGSDFAFVGLYK